MLCVGFADSLNFCSFCCFNNKKFFFLSFFIKAAEKKYETKEPAPLVGMYFLCRKMLTSSLVFKTHYSSSNSIVFSVKENYFLAVGIIVDYLKQLIMIFKNIVIVKTILQV